MRIKWAFYTLSVLFFLNIIGCHIITDYLSKSSSKVNTSSYEKGMITIVWDSSDDPDLTGYRVYYGFSPKKYDNSVDIGNPSESSPGTIKYSLTNIVKGKQYYITVVALNKYNKQSSFSVEVSGVAK